MDIRIDRGLDRPIFLQIVEEVERLAASGTLADGTRMPPTRDLARRLGVNRNTVVAAYQELEARGRTTAHTGRGTFLRAGAAAAGGSIAWESTLGRVADRRALTNTLDLHCVSVQDAEISFATNFPAQDLLPVGPFRRAMDAVLERDGAEILTYGSPLGYLPLRRWIAESMSAAGAALGPDDVLITTGSQQAIDLVARALLNPGDTVLLAEPGFPGALSAVQVYGARVQGVESDAEGIRPEALEGALARGPAKLLYVVSNFHNPTGVTLSEERRRRLLEIAAAHRLPVVEDDSAGDLRFDEPPLPSLLAMDRHHLTTYISSFSKKLLPGLRLGWMVAPRPLQERVIALKQLTDCSTSLLLQAALHTFCEAGHLERHLGTVTAEYRRRRDTMTAALHKHLPGSVRWTEPRGGLVLWVTLPDGMDARDLLAGTRARGVTFNAGEVFYASAPQRNTLRLTFGATPPERIRKGVKILGEVLHRLQDGHNTERRSDREAVPLV